MAFPDFLQCPYFFSNQRWAMLDLFRRARTQLVRAALFGDSQETPAGGAGRVFVPRLNYEMAAWLGNPTETPCLVQGWWDSHYLGKGSSTFGTKPADLTADQWANNPRRTALDRQLPGFAARTYPSDGYCHIALDHNLSTAAAGTGVVGTPSFDVTTAGTGAIRGSMYLFKNVAGDASLFWNTRQSNNASTSADIAYATDATVGLNVNSTTITTYSKLFDLPMPTGGYTYPHLRVRGTSAAGIDIIGGRFARVDQSRGLVWSSFSQGGFQYAGGNSIPVMYPNCGPLLQTLGPWHLTASHYGANDAGSDVTAEDFKNYVAVWMGLRDTLLGASGPSIPHIFFVDPYDHLHTAPQKSEFNQYAGALIALCNQYPDKPLAVVNGYRWTYERGWNAANQATYLSDGVHYTSAGAVLLARGEAEILRRATAPVSRRAAMFHHHGRRRAGATLAGY